MYGDQQPDAEHQAHHRRHRLGGDPARRGECAGLVTQHAEPVEIVRPLQMVDSGDAGGEPEDLLFQVDLDPLRQLHLQGRADPEAARAERDQAQDRRHDPAVDPDRQPQYVPEHPDPSVHPQRTSDIASPVNRDACNRNNLAYSPSLAISRSCGSHSVTRPSESTAIRSARLTVDRRCEIRITETFRTAATTRSKNSASAGTSRCAVGSSSTTSWRPWATAYRARATARRCHWPPDRSTPDEFACHSGVSRPCGSRSISGSAPAARAAASTWSSRTGCSGAARPMLSRRVAG